MKETEQKLATQEVLGKELCDFQGYIEKMKSESKELKSQLASKTEELSDLTEEQEQLKTNHEKQLNKLNKQLETMKGKHDKVMEEKKEKMAHIKEMTKMHKELETDQKNQIKRLTKENDDLKKECESGATKADDKIKELEESKLAKKVKALENEKTENESTILLLETQRNALLDSLERIQKILQGFESVIKDKNEKIQDVSTKLEEAEINLEEAVQKLSASKQSDKEKKESQKLIKQLQSSLKEYESRQFTNAKLISGLEKEKFALEKKVKDVEEKSSHRSSDDLMSNKCKKLERDLRQLRDVKDKAEQELAKNQALLVSKTQELSNVMQQLSHAEGRIKNLEKELRLGPSSTAANSSEEQEDVEELRRTVRTLSERYALLKEEYNKALRESRTSEDPNSNKLHRDIEALKKVAKEAQLKLCRKEKEVERLIVIIHNLRGTSSAHLNGMRLPIKEEPIIFEDEDPVVTHVDTGATQIMELDVGNSAVVEESDSPVNVTDDPYDFCASPARSSENESRINNNGSSSKKRSKSNSKLVDVSDQYHEEDDDITCGICLGWDPPLPPTDPQGSTEKKKKETYTTSWVGCDCSKWYHKQCTGLKRFTSNFSCRSVKKKCQKVPSNVNSEKQQQEEEEDPLKYD